MLPGTHGYDNAGGEEPACQRWRCKRHGFNPWVRKIPWSGAWHTSPVFLPGDSCGLDRGAWRATVREVTKRWTRLKQLSMQAPLLHLGSFLLTRHPTSAHRHLTNVLMLLEASLPWRQHQMGWVECSGVASRPVHCRFSFCREVMPARRMLNTDWEREQEDEDLNDRTVGQLKARTGRKPENECKPRTYDQRQA